MNDQEDVLKLTFSVVVALVIWSAWIEDTTGGNLSCVVTLMAFTVVKRTGIGVDLVGWLLPQAPVAFLQSEEK